MRSILACASPAGGLRRPEPEVYFALIPLEPKWRNWQTRTFEGRVGQPVGVRVPPSAPCEDVRAQKWPPIPPNARRATAELWRASRTTAWLWSGARSLCHESLSSPPRAIDFHFLRMLTP